MSRRLVIKLTHGAEASEIMSSGLTVAATAAASGTPVSLWLTAEATWLGVPGRADAVELENSAPLSELLAAVLISGTVTVNMAGTQFFSELIEKIEKAVPF